MMTRNLLLAALLSLLAGCANLSALQDPPMVSLAGIKVAEAGLLEQVYTLRLRIMNPGRQALRVRGMDYQLWLNDKKFAHGISDREFAVEPYGEEVVEVDVVSNLSSIIRQYQDMREKGRPTNFSYRLAGKLGLAGYSMRVPFEYTDEIALRREE